MPQHTSHTKVAPWLPKNNRKALCQWVQMAPEHHLINPCYCKASAEAVVAPGEQYSPETNAPLSNIFLTKQMTSMLPNPLTSGFRGKPFGTLMKIWECGAVHFKLRDFVPVACY